MSTNPDQAASPKATDHPEQAIDPHLATIEQVRREAQEILAAASSRAASLRAIAAARRYEAAEAADGTSGAGAPSDDLALAEGFSLDRFEEAALSAQGQALTAAAAVYGGSIETSQGESLRAGVKDETTEIPAIPAGEPEDCLPSTEQPHRAESAWHRMAFVIALAAFVLIAAVSFLLSL